MVAVGDQDRGPAAEPPFGAVVEPLQPVHVVQVPQEGAALAVDLQRVERLVAAGVAGGLEQSERAVVEAGEHRGGVVDADRLQLAGFGMLALLDEGLGHRREAADRSVDPDGGVEAVGDEVAGDPRARRRDVEPPGAGAALRHLGRDRPVLEEIGAVVVDAAEQSLLDHLLDQAHRRERGGNCTRPYWARRPSRPRRPSSRLPWRCGRAASRKGSSCRSSPRRGRSPCAGRSAHRCRPRRCRRAGRASSSPSRPNS